MSPLVFASDGTPLPLQNMPEITLSVGPGPSS